MILVDSSVWIEYLSRNNSAVTETINSHIEGTYNLCICGIILQEVLQGIRNTKDFNRIYSILNRIPYLATSKVTYIHAAQLFRTLQLQGITIPTIDILIASIAIQHNTTLYTLDTKHFLQIEKFSNLSLYK